MERISYASIQQRSPYNGNSLTQNPNEMETILQIALGLVIILLGILSLTWLLKGVSTWLLEGNGSHFIKRLIIIAGGGLLLYYTLT